MTIAFDAASSGAGYPPIGVTFSHALGAGSGNNRIVIVAVVTVGPSPHTVTSITYNSAAMTLLTQAITPEYYGRVTTTSVYYLLDGGLPAAAGTYSVYYEIETAYSAVGSALGYTGVEQAAPNYVADTFADGTSHTTDITSSITTTDSSGGLVLALVGVESNGTAITFTPASGQTERTDASQTTIATIGTSDKVYSSTGSVSMTTTPSASYLCYANVLMELPSSGAAADNAALIGACF
jgi:hypothetical protein